MQVSTHNRTLGSDRETLINGRAALEGELPKAACQQMGAKQKGRKMGRERTVIFRLQLGRPTIQATTQYENLGVFQFSVVL